jgi:hypothetical protein
MVTGDSTGHLSDVNNDPGAGASSTRHEAATSTWVPVEN